MRPEKVINVLLTGAAGVTALAGVRVYPGTLPQGTALPALSYEHVDTVPLQTIDANAGFGLVRSRIQVTAIADTYPAVKALLEQVRLACDYARGDIAGVRVVSVLRDTVGPDDRDDDRGVFTQSIDFQITHQEP